MLRSSSHSHIYDILRSPHVLYWVRGRPGAEDNAPPLRNPRKLSTSCPPVSSFNITGTSDRRTISDLEYGTILDGRSD